MSRKLFITDLDNTLYNFIDYYAPCFRGMVHALSKKINISEDDLYSQFKNVYQKYGSLEYGFAVQELECVKHKEKEEIFAVIKVAKGAFSRVRQKNLTTYPHVNTTLQWMQREGILVIGVSNAPAFHALRRLRQLKIENYFSGLVCWEGGAINENAYSKEILDKELSGGYKSKIPKIWKLSKNKLKPNTDGYKLLLKEFNIHISNCYILGDSISKDVTPADEIGAVGIWAKYGEMVEKKNLDTVLKISNWDNKKIETIYFTNHKEPKYTINSFEELKNIIIPTQLTMKF